MNKDNVASWIFSFIVLILSFFYTQWVLTGGYKDSDPQTFWIVTVLLGSCFIMVIGSLLHLLISKAKGSIQIIWDKSNYHYSLGDKISGKVKCIINTPLQINNGVELCLYAVSRRSERANIECFSETNYLPLSNFSFVEPGEYLIPFSLTLPVKENLIKAGSDYQSSISEGLSTSLKELPSFFKDIVQTGVNMSIFSNLYWYLEARVNLPGIDISTRESLSVNTGILAL